MPPRKAGPFTDGSCPCRAFPGPLDTLGNSELLLPVTPALTTVPLLLGASPGVSATGGSQYWFAKWEGRWGKAGVPGVGGGGQKRLSEQQSGLIASCLRLFSWLCLSHAGW